jgi:hypothetical protein
MVSRGADIVGQGSCNRWAEDMFYRCRHAKLVCLRQSSIQRLEKCLLDVVIGDSDRGSIGLGVCRNTSMKIVQRDIGSKNCKLFRDIELGVKWSMDVHVDVISFQRRAEALPIYIRETATG